MDYTESSYINEVSGTEKAESVFRHYYVFIMQSQVLANSHWLNLMLIEALLYIYGLFQVAWKRQHILPDPFIETDFGFTTNLHINTLPKEWICNSNRLNFHNMLSSKENHC